MERPISLRPDLYQAILVSLDKLDGTSLAEALLTCGYALDAGEGRETLVQSVLDKPSAYLVQRCALLNRTDLLTNLFIEFDDEELDAGYTYLIDREAAQEIAAGDATVLLLAGAGGVLVARARIERALLAGCVIDFREPSRSDAENS